MIRLRMALVLAALLSLVAAPAVAKRAERIPEPAAQLEWSQLGPRERADLAPFAHRWHRLPPARRALILERYTRWQHLPEGKRRALRDGARNFSQMSPRQREKMRASLHTVRALPEEEQARLRHAWRTLTPEQRRLWLERGGPGLAAPPPGG